MKHFYIFTLFICVAFNIVAQSSTARNGDATFARTQIKILKTYPNPATTYITFEFQRSYSSGLGLEIYNLPGKKVAAVNNVTSSTTIQLQNFFRGVYLYKLIDKNGKVMESGKFQVTK
jgi:hypothetical protein